ncbi:MAG: hypothetical protein IPK97_20285 [Ahniella sp.]|nr:hypothetical protein [Ahniella sp.]
MKLSAARKKHPFSREREKVAEGRMRGRLATKSFVARFPSSACRHLLPRAGEELLRSCSNRKMHARQVIEAHLPVGIFSREREKNCFDLVQSKNAHPTGH